jgi:membrane-associated phospholipid phosphatase
MIPLIPWMIVPYISFNLLFIIPLIVLPTEVIRRVGITFAVSTIFAGTIFLLFPTHNAFPQVVPQGFFSSLFLGLYSVDLPSNMFPSLHVAYSILFLLFSYPYIRNRSLKIGFVCWVAVVIVSTVFTHQHHVIDVIGGLVLAGVCWVLSERSTVLGTPQER